MQQFGDCCSTLPEAMVVLVREVRQCIFYCEQCTNKAGAADLFRAEHTYLNSIFSFLSLKDPLSVSFFLFFFLAPGLISLYACFSFRYRHTVSLGSIAIMCGFCKPPQSMEATKGCADCKSNFCNECFKLYHPWGTPRAQHEHILPTNNFRPKVCLSLWGFFAS